MKSKLYALYFLLLIYTISCRDEEKPTCPPPLGIMVAQVNDTVEWDFKYTYFREWSDSTVSIFAEFVNVGCELELSMDFLNIVSNFEKQDIVKPIFEEDHPTQNLPNSVFSTWNVDVLTERFDLFENEPAWIQLTEITEERLRGRFQATYVYRPGSLRFWDLPDTLRFNNVDLEATFFAQKVE